MPPKPLATLALAPLLSLSPLAAQGSFLLQRATPGTLGDVVQFQFTGMPQLFLVLGASLTTGTTPMPAELSNRPLDIAPPTLLFTEVVTGANGLTTPIQVPNNLLLAGTTIQWQAGSLPGTTQLFDALSNRATTQLAQPLVATLLPATTVGSAWAAKVRRPDPQGGPGTWLFAGGAQRPTIQQLPLQTSEVLDPLTLEVTAGPMLPDDVYAMTATELLDGTTLLTGGVTTHPTIPGQHIATDGAVLYDPVANTFTAMPPMSTPRFVHAAARLPNGNVVVVGGSASADLAAPLPLPSCEIFDAVTHTWSPGPSLAAPWLWGTLSALPNGELLLHGGLILTPSGLGLAPAPICQRLVTGPGGALAWVPGAPMVNPRVAHDRGTLQLADGRLLVAGGCVLALLGTTPVLMGTADIETYDCSTGTWTAGFPAPQAFFSGTLDQLPDGSVIAAGGISGLLGTGPVPSVPLAHVMQWNPATGVWQNLAPMQMPRMLGGSVTTPDGLLVLLGGQMVAGPGPCNTTAEALRTQ